MDFSCLPCNRHFGSIGALQQHKQDSPKHKALRSEDCDRNFTSQQALQQHLQDSPVHNTIGHTLHSETYDSSSGVKEAKKKQRQDSVLSDKDLPCDACNRFFGTQEALETHKENSSIHKKRTYCGTCNIQFVSKEALVQHQRDSPVHKKSFRCTTCDDTFGSIQTLDDHKKDCQVQQGHSEPSQIPSASSQRQEIPSSKTRVKRPTLDIPALILKRHPRALESIRPATIAALTRLLEKNLRAPTQETKEYFKFPELHTNVEKSVFPEIRSTWFQKDENNERFDNEYFSNVRGVFLCTNTNCKAELWASGIVTIQIRGYARNGYNAIVFNQRCRSCNKLGSLVLDEETYVERVAYRIKKWAGVEMELPYYEEKHSAPHMSRLCEGCKRRICREGAKSGFF